MAASPGIPLDTAVIMSSVLEGILYGFSVLMFLGTIWIIIYKRHTHDVNWPAVAVATLLFLLSTVHVVAGIIRIEGGLVKHRDTFPGGPAAFFADISEETFVVKDAILVLTNLAWRRCGAFGVVTLYDLSQASSNNVFTNKTGHLVATFMTLTLATNLFSSGLLAYRIWKSERKVSGIRATKRKMPLLRVFLDAAILYSAALCSSIICFILSNNGLYVMPDLNVPIISIAFYMVFIRMTSSRHNRDYISTVLGGGSELEHRNSQQHPMQSLHDIYRQNDTTSFLADHSKAHTLA
ncbi:uncharacterized protein F5891DRAFT_1186383 [Suillus fuscotomentosus]|uniref:Uncharacterized protein n=1 Tax=Suillus fuscotomentosus TaxID=1912939 RepID=A0AAD4HN98_9AGAM|nr:uncharacterized protein F5891DRAFT_1186383 [Suillus fuscotomentosus]KAG1902742.1 hypothetical protein F5891DRAFT_1186383 [Suillus fuscotomentosus]